MTDASRPQDQNRPHRRRRRVSAADRSLIETYYDALRSELRTSLAELQPVTSPQLTIDGAPKVDRPSLDKRSQLVRYMAFVVREHGADVDGPDRSVPETPAGAVPVPPRRRRVVYE